MSGFQVFPRPVHRGRSPIPMPTIRVDRERGTVHLRSVALRALDGDGRLAQRVSFVYDLDDIRWGIRLEPAHDEHAYRIHRTGRSSGFVQASAFVRWWGASGEYRLERRPVANGIAVGVMSHRPVYPFWEAVR